MSVQQVLVPLLFRSDRRRRRWRRGSDAPHTRFPLEAIKIILLNRPNLKPTSAVAFDKRLEIRNAAMLPQLGSLHRVSSHESHGDYRIGCDCFPDLWTRLELPLRNRSGGCTQKILPVVAARWLIVSGAAPALQQTEIRGGAILVDGISHCHASIVTSTRKSLGHPRRGQSSISHPLLPNTALVDNGYPVPCGDRTIGKKTDASSTQQQRANPAVHGQFLGQQ